MSCLSISFICGWIIIMKLETLCIKWEMWKLRNFLTFQILSCRKPQMTRITLDLCHNDQLVVGRWASEAWSYWAVTRFSCPTKHLMVRFVLFLCVYYFLVKFHRQCSEREIQIFSQIFDICFCYFYVSIPLFSVFLNDFMHDCLSKSLLSLSETT